MSIVARLSLDNRIKKSNQSTVLESQIRLVFTFLPKALLTFWYPFSIPLKIKKNLLLTSFLGSAGFFI
jgi:hypothetical protein